MSRIIEQTNLKNNSYTLRGVAARELVLVRRALARGGRTVQEHVGLFVAGGETDFTAQSNLSNFVFDIEIWLFFSVDGEDCSAIFGNELNPTLRVGGDSATGQETIKVGHNVVRIDATANGSDEFSGTNVVLVLDINTFSSGT